MIVLIAPGGGETWPNGWTVQVPVDPEITVKARERTASDFNDADFRWF